MDGYDWLERALVNSMKEKGCVVPLPQCRSGSQPRVPPIRKRVSFFEFSLCLSRACLGEMIVGSIKWHRERTRFLCLSRACLGKMIQKVAFPYLAKHTLAMRVVHHRQRVVLFRELDDFGQLR